MSKKFLIVLAIIIIAGVAVFISNNKTEAPSEEANQTQTKSPASSTTESTDGARLLPQENVVIYTNAGYSPSPIKVKIGETIIFKNNGSQPMWTASAVHPTHMAYPGSDIKKCGTSEANKIFDACAGIPSGESWSFKFDNAGEWKYHNHLNTGHYGAIIVE